MSASQSQIDADASALLKIMINGYRVSQMIFVASKLHIADLLAAGPMTIEQLAGATRPHSESLQRILRGTGKSGHFLRRPGWPFSPQSIGHSTPARSTRFTMGFCRFDW